MKFIFDIRNKKHIVLVLLLGAMFVASIYLAYLKYTNSSGICNFSAAISCSVVESSEYSIILGIPLPLLGITYAIFNTFFYLIKHEKEGKISKNTKEILSNVELTVNTFGALAALTFIFLQFFEIKSICVFCMIFDISTMIYTAFLYKEVLGKNSK